MPDKDLESQFEQLFDDDSLDPEAVSGEDERPLEEAISDLLGEKNADVGRASVDIDRASADIGQASADIGQASADIGQASADIGQASADIGQASGDVDREGIRAPGPMSTPVSPAEFPPPVLERLEASTEGVSEEREPPSLISGKIRVWNIPLGIQRFRALSILLHGATILGGVLFIFLLARLIWWKTLIQPGSNALYIIAYTVVVAITLVQWLFNSSLSTALQEAEDKYAKAALSQTQLKEKTEELAISNALLQKRALQLQTAMLIAQTISPVLDPQRLQQKAVDLIREQFDLYYVGLFLVDESGTDDNRQWAVLQAATGEAGQHMLDRGYRLKLDDMSTVGWCIIQDQARISPDLPGSRPNVRREHPMKRPAEDLARINSQLPKTRSVIVLPLRSRDQVLGALDIHSAERDAFSQEDIALLQALADQVAIAIDNAHLFAEKQASLEEMERDQRRRPREKWMDLPSSRMAPSYERTRPDVPALRDVDTGQTSVATTKDFQALGQTIRQAIAHKETVVRPSVGNGQEQAALVAPISLRGETLGALGLQDEEKRRWTTDEIVLIETVADQMALAIENARLLGETQRRAERERLAADISAQIRASTRVDTILRTAIREIGRALGASDGLIRLGSDNEPGSIHLGQEGGTDNDHADA